MSAFPYMRFYVGDYLGDTRHLTTLEHGAYLLLIFAYFQRGEPLPDDDRKLAHIAGLSVHKWRAIRDTVVEFFEQKEGRFFHKRIEKEIAERSAKSLQAKEAGLTSAQRRLNGRSTIPESIVHSPKGSDKSDPMPPADADGERDDLFEEAPPSGGCAIGEKYTAPFERWWSGYPNKEGKRKAAQAYDAAFKRLGGASAGSKRVHGVLLAALAAQCRIWQRKGVAGRYIPHATTWLNRSGFSDEPVLQEMTTKALAQYATPEPVELRPPDEPPPDERRAKWRGERVGWTPDDEEEQ